MKTIKFDATHGLYHRTLGMDTAGRKPKFWLGDDEAQAQRRVERLEMLWSQVEADWKTLPLQYPNWLETEVVTKPDKPLWDEITLAAARVIAKGGIAYPLPRNPQWSPYKYTVKITDLQRRFNAVQFTPEESAEEFHKIGADLFKMEAEQDIRAGKDKLALVAGQFSGATFHQALDAYIAKLDKLPDESGWYNTQMKQTRRLKENLPDINLAQLGLDKCEEFIDFWRHRPVIKEKTMAVTTCRNEIIQLDMILDWLDRSEQFNWQVPRGFGKLKRKVKDADTSLPAIDTFTIDELKILWTYASPLVRLQMALALNCGFKYAEIATLAIKEIHLKTEYPGIVRLGKPEGKSSWVCRFRRKTKVYGEFKLWPMTVSGIEWATLNRKVPVKGKSDFLLITRSGRNLNARTSGKNKSDKMYSSWRNLFSKVKKEHGEIKYLPFKHLEKTASEWIRHEFGGEIASLFLSHGKPVKNDAQLEVYANKPFPKLFTALDALADYLRPVFESVPEPWKVVGPHRLKPEVVVRVKELRSQGMKLTDIAEAVGLHWVTVGKICRQK